MLKTCYLISRVAAYLAGLSGLVCFSMGHQRGQPALAQTGTVLLTIAFSAFMVSFVLYAALRLRRRPSGSPLDAYRSRPRRRGGV